MTCTDQFNQTDDSSKKEETTTQRRVVILGYLLLHIPFSEEFISSIQIILFSSNSNRNHQIWTYVVFTEQGWRLKSSSSCQTDAVEWKVQYLHINTHPDEQLGHDDVSQLTGSVEGGARRWARPGRWGVDLVLGAVGQKEQQSGQISLGHRGQQPRRHTVLRGRLESRHKRPLIVLSTNPRLPLLTCETDTEERSGQICEHSRLQKQEALMSENLRNKLRRISLSNHWCAHICTYHAEATMLTFLYDFKCLWNDFHIKRCQASDHSSRQRFNICKCYTSEYLKTRPRDIFQMSFCDRNQQLNMKKRTIVKQRNAKFQHISGFQKSSQHLLWWIVRHINK